MPKKSHTNNELHDQEQKRKRQRQLEKFQESQHKREKNLVRIRLDNKTEVLTNNPEKYGK
jgi:hypothetical protein